MIYYRVKPEYDQRRTKDNFLIANELYTERERNSMPEVSDKIFECIEIPEHRVYWCFGARFAIGGTNA
jgi:hypothetical protein